MTKTMKKLVNEIQALPDKDQMQLVDAILVGLDKPDPEIDKIWAQEARKRWSAYKAGKISTVSYETVMERHHRP